jgi:methylase of polypeptide subunit release factors
MTMRDAPVRRSPTGEGQCGWPRSSPPTLVQRGVRLATALVVASPGLRRFLRGPFRRYFDSLAPRWDQLVGLGHLDALAAALVDLSPPRRALDIGAGTGATAFHLAEHFSEVEVTGVDLSPAMVAASQAKTPPQHT